MNLPLFLVVPELEKHLTDLPCVLQNKKKSKKASKKSKKASKKAKKAKKKVSPHSAVSVMQRAATAGMWALLWCVG